MANHRDKKEVDVGDHVRLISDIEKLENMLGNNFNPGMARFLAHEGVVRQKIFVGEDEKIKIAQVEGLGSYWYDVRVLEHVERATLNDSEKGESTGEEESDRAMTALLRSVLSKSKKGSSGDKPVKKRHSLGRASTRRSKKSAKFEVGDYVEIVASAKEMEKLAEGHGGFVPSMAAYCGKRGFLKEVREDRNVAKAIMLGDWWYNLKCFKIIRRADEMIHQNNVVKVTSDEAHLRHAFGDSYNDSIADLKGKFAVATKVDFLNQQCKLAQGKSDWFSFDLLSNYGPLHCLKNGENLKLSVANSNTFSCDVCKASIAQGSEMFSCRPCDFDMCMSCARKKIKTLEPLSKAVEFVPPPHMFCTLLYDSESVLDASALEELVSAFEAASSGRVTLLPFCQKDLEERGAQDWARRSSCVFVLLSAGFLRSHFCLGQLGRVTKARVPILPIVLKSSDTRENFPDFDQLKSIRADSPLFVSGWGVPGGCSKEKVVAELNKAGRCTLILVGEEQDPKQAAQAMRRELERVRRIPRQSTLKFWQALQGVIPQTPRFSTRKPSVVKEELSREEQPQGEDQGLGKGKEEGLATPADVETERLTDAAILKNSGVGVFLSHAWGHKGETHLRVLELKKALEAENVDAWVDEEQLKAGDAMHTKLRQAMESKTHFVVCVTEDYIRKVESNYLPDYCFYEFNWAIRNRCNAIIPVILEARPAGEIFGRGQMQLLDIFLRIDCEDRSKIQAAAKSIAKSLVQYVKEANEQR